MKSMILCLLFLVSSHALAWEKVSDTYLIYGTKIEQSQKANFKPFAEIAYNKTIDNFGISFVGRNGIREILPYGIFYMRSCNINTVGAIAGTSIVDTSTKDQMGRVFLKCNRPIIFRVWDVNNNFATYKFENAGPLIKEE